VPATARLTLQSVDSEHGNVLKDYAAMGKPLSPTPAQVEQLNRETKLPPPREARLQDGKLSLTLEPDALVLVTVQH
jgi:xylan 1,4-beta-xylosidase